LGGSIICLTLGILSGILSGSGDSEWYQQLLKPEFNPPSWIFAPVWTILYIMMGVALGDIWTQRESYKILLILFVVQLLLNLAWSPLFFWFHRIDFALYDLILLWLVIIIFMFHARRLNRVMILFIPYFLWVSFALVLNLNINLLNK
jgi:tryptophan-rich sensory protein